MSNIESVEMLSYDNGAVEDVDNRRRYVLFFFFLIAVKWKQSGI